MNEELGLARVFPNQEFLTEDCLQTNLWVNLYGL
jgi:hypothetical protein